MKTIINRAVIGPAIAALLLFCGISLVLAADPISTSEYTAYKTDVAPTIDGVGNDAVWKNATWYAIDQKWMPYNNIENNPEVPGNTNTTSIDGKEWRGPDDFTGKFKVLWSEKENLLYFLAEIEDDVRIDNYTCGAGGYPDFDVLELFINESNLKRRHVWNDSGSDEKAANAFSYHIITQLGDWNENEAQNELCVMDLKGTAVNDWSAVDYSEHIPTFAARKNGNIFVYEFALTVYSDEYNVNATVEANEDCIVTLTNKKEMGLAVAFCDNDHNSGPSSGREHFFGSVPLPPDANNSCWVTTEHYGMLTLSEKYIGYNITVIGGTANPAFAEEGETVTITADDLEGYEFLRWESDDVEFADATATETTFVMPGKNVTVTAIFDGIGVEEVAVETIALYPNPASGYINLTIGGASNGEVTVDLYSVTGAQVGTLYQGKASESLQIPLDVAAGSYICVVRTAQTTKSIGLIVK